MIIEDYQSPKDKSGDNEEESDSPVAEDQKNLIEKIIHLTKDLSALEEKIISEVKNNGI